MHQRTNSGGDKPTAFVRTLERAMEHVGSRQRLAELIDVELATLDLWMSGSRLPPDDVFLRVLDLAFPASPPVAFTTPAIGPASQSAHPHKSSH